MTAEIVIKWGNLGSGFVVMFSSCCVATHKYIYGGGEAESRESLGRGPGWTWPLLFLCLMVHL